MLLFQVWVFSIVSNYNGCQKKYIFNRAELAQLEAHSFSEKIFKKFVLLLTLRNLTQFYTL